MEYQTVIKRTTSTVFNILQISSILYVISLLVGFNIFEFFNLTIELQRYFTKLPKEFIFIYFLGLYFTSFIYIFLMLFFLNYHRLNGNLESIDTIKFATKRPLNQIMTILYYYIVSVFLMMFLCAYVVYFGALSLIYSPALAIVFILILFSLKSITHYMKKNTNFLISKIISSFISAIFIVLTYLLTKYFFGFGITETSLSAIITALILGLLGFSA